MAEESKTKRIGDMEILALAAVQDILNYLDHRSRDRILSWLGHKYAERIETIDSPAASAYSLAQAHREGFLSGVTRYAKSLGHDATADGNVAIKKILEEDGLQEFGGEA